MVGKSCRVVGFLIPCFRLGFFILPHVLGEEDDGVWERYEHDHASPY